MERGLTTTGILLMVLLLSGCKAVVPEPTVTPTQTDLPTSTSTFTLTASYTPSVTPTDTPIPSPTVTNTLRPPTRTPRPETPIPVGVALPQPVGTPMEEWNGLPIMPRALAGQADSGSYIFITMATPAEVQAYYETEMSSLGWTLLAAGSGGGYGSIMLIFIQGTSTASVTIIPQENGTTYVMLIR